MRDTNRVAIAKVVIRQKESLVAIRPLADHDVLEMATMLFADEVVDPARLDDIPAAEDVKTNKREIDIAKQLIESLAGEFEPTKYKDTYREAVLAMIEKKAAGEEIVIQAAEEEAAPVPDLMSALKASLDAVRERTDDDAGDDAKPKRKRASSAKSGGAKKAKSRPSSAASIAAGGDDRWVRRRRAATAPAAPEEGRLQRPRPAPGQARARLLDPRPRRRARRRPRDPRPASTSW